MRKISYIMKCFCLCLLAGLLFACDAERDAEPMGCHVADQGSGSG